MRWFIFLISTLTLSLTKLVILVQIFNREYSFLLLFRCSTIPVECGTKWELNSVTMVYWFNLLTFTRCEVLNVLFWYIHLVAWLYIYPIPSCANYIKPLFNMTSAFFFCWWFYSIYVFLKIPFSLFPFLRSKFCFFVLSFLRLFSLFQYFISLTYFYLICFFFSSFFSLFIFLNFFHPFFIFFLINFLFSWFLNENPSADINDTFLLNKPFADIAIVRLCDVI